MSGRGDGPGLDEIVRRNRCRAIAMVAVAAANAWLLLSILAFVAILLPSRHVEVARMAAVAVALGAPITALILSPMLWARRRTLGRLGTVEPGPGELRREKNLPATPMPSYLHCASCGTTQRWW